MFIQASDFFAMSPQIILISGGLLILLVQMILRSGQAKAASLIAVATLTAAGIVVVFGLSDANGMATLLPKAFLGTEVVTAFSGSYRYSVFSGNAILLILILGICAIVLGRRALSHAEIHFAENYFLLLMSLVGYSYAFCAEDLITLFVGFELGALPMLILVGMNRQDAAANEAAVKYMLLSAFAVAFLLLGIALLYGSNATLKLREIKELGPHYLKNRSVTAAYLFVFTGFLFKIAAFPLHTYIADVYEGAATVFTSFLASISKAASALILLKVVLGMHDAYRQFFAPVFTIVAIGSMLYGSLAAMVGQNLKRILAYSSIAHAGALVCFFVVPSTTDLGTIGFIKQDGGSALYLYIVGYAFSALLVFATIAHLEIADGHRQVITLDSLKNLYRRDKLAAWSLAIGVLSFMGMPPLAGFMGKFHLFRYLALSNNLVLAAAAAFASALSVYAYIRILKPIFFAEPDEGLQGKATVFPVHYGVRFAIAFLGLAVGFFAAYSGFLYNYGIAAIHKIY